MYYNLQEIYGEVNEVIGRQGLVVSFNNLLVAVNAVVVEHIQQQLLTENPKTSQKQEKIISHGNRIIIIIHEISEEKQ